MREAALYSVEARWSADRVLWLEHRILDSLLTPCLGISESSPRRGWRYDVDERESFPVALIDVWGLKPADRRREWGQLAWVISWSLGMSVTIREGDDVLARIEAQDAGPGRGVIWEGVGNGLDEQVIR